MQHANVSVRNTIKTMVIETTTLEDLGLALVRQRCSTSAGVRLERENYLVRGAALGIKSTSPHLLAAYVEDTSDQLAVETLRVGISKTCVAKFGLLAEYETPSIFTIEATDVEFGTCLGIDSTSELQPFLEDEGYAKDKTSEIPSVSPLDIPLISRPSNQ